MKILPNTSASLITTGAKALNAGAAKFKAAPKANIAGINNVAGITNAAKPSAKPVRAELNPLPSPLPKPANPEPRAFIPTATPAIKPPPPPEVSPPPADDGLLPAIKAVF